MPEEQVNIQETVDAIKIMVIGSMLADYGARLMKDKTKQTLKYRVNCILQAVKNFEMQFLNDNKTTDYYRQAFKKAFNSNETVLLADLNLTCHGLNEDGLEIILDAVKQAIVETPNQ